MRALLATGIINTTRSWAACCSTEDPDTIAAFAVYRGTDALDGTEFLIDGSGRLRAMWSPGLEPDWDNADVLAARSWHSVRSRRNRGP